ncbi:MAG TPA: hypothetical protein VG897_00300 [Terriglobales bacterium]|nr:hypothetical protein [Terriglobales bacterium]
MYFTRLLAAALAFAAPASAATMISFTSPPATDTGPLFCVNQINDYCDTTAFFGSSSLADLNLGGIAPLFMQAFDNWNGTPSNPGQGGGGWTLNYSDELSGFFDITASVDYVGNHSIGNASAGEVHMSVDVSRVNFPTLGPDELFVWVQAIYYNFGAGTILNLDVDNPGCNSYNPANPEYPCDTNTTATNSSASGLSFFDLPHGQFGNPDAPPLFFDANTYLAVENTVNSTLTVLDGFCYGFQNNVSVTNSPLPPLTPAANVCSAESATTSSSPEPDVGMLCAAGLIAILAIGHRRMRHL